MHKSFMFFLAFLLIASGICLADDSQVTIIYENSAQFELISPEGTRILIDITNPDFLSVPANNADILLTTHSHYDHLRAPFLNKFPGQQLFIQTGEIQTPTVKIKGIASCHDETEDFSPKGGSNYIYLVEMGGLRIVHFGDIGQTSLTPEQLNVLGEVDVALTQLSNPSYSNMDLENLKGFKLIDQIKPKIIIPTHADEATIKYAAKKYNAGWLNKPFKIAKGNIPSKTSFIFMGAWADYAKTQELVPEW